MECVRLFETVFVFVVESWNIAVNLDGILLFELSTQFSYSSLYFLKKVNIFIERNLSSFFFGSLLSSTLYLKQIKKKKKKPQPRHFLFGGSYNECSYDTFVTCEQFINHFAIVSAKDFVSVIVQTVQYHPLRNRVT